MKLEMNLMEIDPAGEVNENELKELSHVEDAVGGATPVILGGVIAASIALCPTTKCTSQCS